MIIKVAVAGPFLTALDYQCKDNSLPIIGGRVWVKLRNKKQIGIVLQLNATSNLAIKKIIFIDEVIDKEPLFSAKDLVLLKWAAHYYHQPIGNVLQSAIPKNIRLGNDLDPPKIIAWQLTKTGKQAKSQIKINATLQLKLMDFLLKNNTPVTQIILNKNLTNWRNAIKKFIQLNWVTEIQLNCLHSHKNTTQIKPTLNQQQQQAVNEVFKKSGFKSFLLEGITGSGKTETYLGMIEVILKQGKQALVLVPEIGLTPQTVARFEAYLQQPIALIHSGLSNKERHCAWMMIKTNKIKVLLGTRSAVFTPFYNLGICILDEEHDISFKQQTSFRYSARDCLVRRAKIENVPVILGTATPSLETLHNALQNKYGHLKLTQRATGASLPYLQLLDIRADTFALENAGISTKLFTTIKQHLQNNSQVLLFLNRRGYAPALICQDCGWHAHCQSCDANMTYHHQYKQLKCHHCGFQQKSATTCPSCNSTKLTYQGHGTEKLTEVVQTLFPDKIVLRVDRDTTKNKGQMQAITTKAAKGEADILVGTQMLAKGHHFPNVTLVAILDLDQGLFNCDFRASERMAQLVVQVSGRAGRATKKGEVIIQTFNPQHPLLNSLINDGYQQFAKLALTDRKTANLPPYSFQIMLRAEATDPNIGWGFLQDIQQALQQQALGQPDLEVFGPVPAPMLRKEARFRYQLLLQANNRGSLHNWLGTIESQIYAHPLVNKLRWSIDVDPQDMS